MASVPLGVRLESASAVLMVAGLAAFVYGIATEGWMFILKAVFSPEI